MSPVDYSNWSQTYVTHILQKHKRRLCHKYTIEYTDHVDINSGNIHSMILTIFTVYYVDYFAVYDVDYFHCTRYWLFSQYMMLINYFHSTWYWLFFTVYDLDFFQSIWYWLFSQYMMLTIFTVYAVDYFHCT